MLRTCSAVALLALGACRVFDSSLIDVREDAADLDGGLDAALDADAADASDAGADASCESRKPASRPLGAPGEDTLEAFYAIRGIDLDQGGEWAIVGYDLDGLCSYGEMPTIECLPPARMGEPELDGEGGIDNVFAHQAIPLILLAIPTLESDAQYAQNRGLGAILLRIRRWNGLGDDPQIDATMTQSTFGIAPNDAGTGPAEQPSDAALPRDDAGYVSFIEPQWDGGDYWWARSDTFLAGDPEQPLIRDDNAYVRDRTVVVRLPDRVPIAFSGLVNGISFRLTDAVLTAELSADFARVEQATIAGRWAVIDILETVPGAGVCPGTGNYTQFQRVLDLVADLRSRPGTGGPRVFCDALSVAMRFTDGVRAHFSGLYAPDVMNPVCRDVDAAP